MSQQAIGIDIGGTGIKGAIVDLEMGELLSDRIRLNTPRGGMPEDVLATVAELLSQLPGATTSLPIGIAFPAAVTHGITRTAANIDDSWIGLQADTFFSHGLGHSTTLVNDADAAGMAEVRFGAAKDHPGLVIMTTLGTGIGSAIINHGKLVPNSELGHIDIGKYPDYERFASSVVRERENLSWSEWAKRLERFFTTVENLFWPELFVVGGGISKKHEKFLPLLTIRTPIVAAVQRNNAGILGAAALAAEGEALNLGTTGLG